MAPVRPNIDAAEIGKFERLADQWWDRQGQFKALHDINPLRLDYIDGRARLAGRQVLDVGCGGGILTEAMAKRGAAVTGIDLAEASLRAASTHGAQSGLSIDYRHVAVEQLADEQSGTFDIVTCLEMLEHVPDVSATVNACARLTKPDGHIFFSTLNRNPKSFLFAIVGAEYILNLIPKGTHEFARFIRPSELARCARDAGLHPADITGLVYNPITRGYALSHDVTVNYLMHARKA
ncbi:MAG: bifunctional 2-polyprenyl-6-hydroxyphenol methylase/3-demethylubiquinol 3-O-methyltransferase UbiG [Gammaproteobacteria bacterium]|nr:bifunctional 2-polyprenyl-6-hydroxyphenol methylase/3-demethylubiquinol 3-O-methyltransferase UbiG [Gammaproteobacteria bacterium]MBA3731279.1 bifunctional 2-polyprenyl-6-hydroxyphenol methylase/3-demethylubiquinol 3-O-methyltransferase UbiG [Gammaproteobacteria bacterium]